MKNLTMSQLNNLVNELYNKGLLQTKISPKKGRKDFRSLMLIERLSVIEVLWQITFSSKLNN